jgi:Ca2+-binding RTX toxin-like protein
VTVDYGDGTGEQTINVPVGNRSFALSHIYSTEGTYILSVTVEDDDLGVLTDSFQVTVFLNTPPVADAGGPYTVDEGSELTLDGSNSSDKENNIVSWEWDLDNDGEYDEAIGQTTTFTWPDNGSYTAGLKVTDSYGEFSIDTFQVTVENTVPVITVASLDHEVIVENGVVTLSGSFADAGVPDTHKLSVNWNDGTTSWAAIYADTRTFTASHQYLDDDPTATSSDIYAIELTLTDNDGGITTGELPLTVNNVTPVITELSNSAPVVGDAGEGEQISISGAFTDVGTLDTHTASIDWGDGTVGQAMLVQGSGSFGGIHAYEFGGIYEIVVTLTDDDGGVTSQSTTALITGVGLNDGVFQIIGTAGKDDVHVKAKGKHRELIEVKAKFLPDKGHQRTFHIDEIDSLVILLGEGKDKVKIDKKIELPVWIDGGDGDDDLKAGGGDDILLGGAGDDKLKGGKGDDVLVGGPGDDDLKGEHGDDILLGGAGDDKLKGGKGDDVLVGGPGDDDLKGEHGDDILLGGAGADKLKGGNDHLNGGLGRDKVKQGGSDWGSDGDIDVTVTMQNPWLKQFLLDIEDASDDIDENSPEWLTFKRKGHSDGGSD